MAKISQECIDAAFEALKTFTRPELEQYVRDVFVRAKQYTDVDNMKAFDRAMKEINDERLEVILFRLHSESQQCPEVSEKMSN